VGRALMENTSYNKSRVSIPYKEKYLDTREKKEKEE
jgi:hypothetical protein